jgi:glycosyltransferase involved in cell wall biosynthesis
VFAAHSTDRTGGNPDLGLLYAAVERQGGIEIEAAPRRRLLTERWDAIHVYWPEWCVRRDAGLAATAVDCGAFLLELWVARLRGARVVWSANNLRPHEVDAFGVITGFVRMFSRLVDQVVGWTQTALDELAWEYPAVGSADQRVVRPGHYRGVYVDDDIPAADARQRLGIPSDAKVALCLGMVRPYKNVHTVLRAHRDLARSRDDTFLLIAGEALDPDYGDLLRREADGLTRVRLDLGFVDDSRLQIYLRAADCAVVPAPFVLNSGSALLALSFDTRVVVPHRGSFVEWREAVGTQWVHTYDGGFRASVLDQALSAQPPSGRPPLEQYFDWARAGRLMAAALHDVVGS